MNNDRKTLIRLASSLPKGSDERRTLLAELQKQAAPRSAGSVGMKAPKKILEDLMEIAADHRTSLSSSQNQVWARSGSVSTCPVCGSGDTERQNTYGDSEGLNSCNNCGSWYKWAAKVQITPVKILRVDFNNTGKASLRQYPTKGSYLGDEAVDWASYPLNVESW